jgi:hypothetical protein
MIIRKLSPEQRTKAVWWILAFAQLSLAASGILSHFFPDRFPFLIGILTGFSVVGNLFFLSQINRMKPRTSR